MPSSGSNSPSSVQVLASLDGPLKLRPATQHNIPRRLESSALLLLLLLLLLLFKN